MLFSIAIRLIYLSLTSTTSASLQCLNAHGRNLLRAKKRPGKTTAPLAKTSNILLDSPRTVFLRNLPGDPTVVPPHVYPTFTRCVRPFSCGRSVGYYPWGTIHRPPSTRLACIHSRTHSHSLTHTHARTHTRTRCLGVQRRIGSTAVLPPEVVSG